MEDRCEGKLLIKVEFQENTKQVVAHTKIEVEYPVVEVTEKYINERALLVLQQSNLLMDNAMGVSKRLTDYKNK